MKKENITDEKFTAEIVPAQEKISTGKTLSVIGIIGLIGSFLSMFASDAYELMPLFISLCIISLVLWLLGARIKKENRKIVKQIIGPGILQPLLEAVFKNVKYLPSGYIHSIDSSEYGFHYDEASGSDYIITTYKDVKIEMSNVVLKEEYSDSDGHTDYERRFRGLWIICDFERKPTANVHVIEKGQYLRQYLHFKFKSGINIKTGNESFDNRYFVRSDDEREALELLTPKMMEYIRTISMKAGARTYISFLKDGKVHIALNSDKLYFESSDSSDSTEIRDRFKSEIHQIAQILDLIILACTEQ